jgi:soluble lytic murein transglycosylase-like protein
MEWTGATASSNISSKFEAAQACANRARSESRAREEPDRLIPQDLKRLLEDEKRMANPHKAVLADALHGRFCQRPIGNQERNSEVCNKEKLGRLFAAFATPLVKRTSSTFGRFAADSSAWSRR